jgi:hypothetical protein
MTDAELPVKKRVDKLNERVAALRTDGDILRNL